MPKLEVRQLSRLVDCVECNTEVEREKSGEPISATW